VLASDVGEEYNEVTMMGYGVGYGMMGGFGLFAGLTGLVILVDLVLLGIWLWQQISKK
jgi:uncharacterized membrane protein